MKNEDSELFRRELRDVKPLNAADRVYYNSGPVMDNTSSRQDDEASFSLSDIPYEGEMQFRHSGVQPKVMKRLRRGEPPPGGEIDLHGFDRNRARSLVSAFIAESRFKRRRVIKIIHGKGLMSEDKKPVLKPLLNSWLRQIPQVLAFCRAVPEDGGDGAVYVLLKKRPDG